jgi:choline-glycine betaine transporter
VVLVAVFFISGAGASSVVLGSLSSLGAVVPSTWVTVLWGALTGTVAAALLRVGSLQALRTLTLVAAAPFILIMTGLCTAVMADLSKDPFGASARLSAPPSETRTERARPLPRRRQVR